RPRASSTGRRHLGRLASDVDAPGPRLVRSYSRTTRQAVCEAIAQRVGNSRRLQAPSRHHHLAPTPAAPRSTVASKASAQAARDSGRPVTGEVGTRPASGVPPTSGSLGRSDELVSPTGSSPHFAPGKPVTEKAAQKKGWTSPDRVRRSASMANWA